MTINLTLPTSWHTCTASQLEKICLAQQQALTSNTADQRTAWKLNCFLSLTGLEIEEDPHPDEQGERFVIVKHTIPITEERLRVGEHCSGMGRGEGLFRKEEGAPSSLFRLYLWQIHSFIKENLAFLDTPPNIPRFPYPEWHHDGITFRGPSLYLSGWTWQQYRLLKDYLDYYFKIEERAANNPVSDGSPVGEKLQEAMQMVLATLYDAETDYLDETTHMPAHGYHYRPEQSTANAPHFHTFPPIRFAVILLWWASVAMKLQKDYPKCFSSGKPNKKSKHPKPQDPTFDYARTTATLEKYMGVNEQELQQESYTVVLQHLQDMIKQNEDIERMNQRMKSKR